MGSANTTDTALENYGSDIDRAVETNVPVKDVSDAAPATPVEEKAAEAPTAEASPAE